ncbi:MAG: alanine dehydrogenase [Dehalococcoidia bacterium]|nr:alanine dehydrogenase [Dehalococcoidia bacterium]
MEDVLELVERAFAERGQGRTQMPPKSYLFFTPHNGDLRVMPAYLQAIEQAGVKLVNVHPDNPSRHGLPTVMATVVLVNPATGEPLCIMDGTLLTAMRTGAASGVATNYLARESAATLGVIGAGFQSWFQIDAIARVRQLSRVGVFDLVPSKARELSDRVSHELHVSAGPVATLEELVRSCDILVTVTPSRVPLVQETWVHEGTHINGVGADAPGKQELEPAILRRARVVVDDWEQASHSGEINVPLSRGELRREDIAAEIGEIVAGLTPGRVSDTDVTVFDTTGLAIQDVICAWRVYELAEKSDRGMAISGLFH